MSENLRVICVAGLPGSGKTELCKALEESGDFKRVERDAYIESIRNEIRVGNFKVLRRILGQFVDSARISGFRDAQDYSELVTDLLSLSNMHIGVAFQMEPTLLSNTINWCAEYQAMQEASSQAKSNTRQRILYESGVLTSRSGRDSSLGFFPAHDISPSVLVVRAKVHHLMQSAEERGRDSLIGDHWGDRLDVESAVKEEEPVEPSEPWHAVIRLNNGREKSLVDLANSIRQRLLTCAENTITGPIGFVIDK